MSYPNQSNFQSGEPMAAWWSVGTESPAAIMASEGRAVNRRIQQKLNELGYRGLPSASASVPRVLTVDGALGYASLSALKLAAADHQRNDPTGGYSVIVDAIAEDLRQSRISLLTMRWALWLTYARAVERFNRAGYSSVVIPRDAILPRFGTTPDDNRTTDTAPVVWTEGETPPAARARGAAVSGSNRSTGGSGSAASGSALTPVVAPSWLDGTTGTVPNKVVAGAAAVAVAAAVVAVAAAMKKKKKNKPKPKTQDSRAQLGAGQRI